MTTAGRKLLSSVVNSGDMQAYLKLGLSPHLFKDSENELYEVISTHVSKFGKIPAQDTILSLNGFEDSLVATQEPPAFYLEEVERRYLYTTLKKMAIQLTTSLEDNNVESALSALGKAMEDLYQKTQRSHLFDFRDAQEIIYQAYVGQKTMGDQMGLMYGWPTLDNMTGGLRGGDFCTFVGRPASGKTFQLLYNALGAWKTGRVPLFISMEMNRVIIAQRLTAMYSKKNLTMLLKAKMSTSTFNAMMLDLSEASNSPNPFWVVDGNLATSVKDVLMLCRQLNPSAVFVDGAYLLRHENTKIGKFDRISENAEGLKQRIATDFDIPVVASYQFNRTASKKVKDPKSTDTPGLEDIYGSDSMGQLSTVSLGLFEPESVETMLRRTVVILKGRNGEVGKFDINWNFHGMDFSEYTEQKPSQLQFCG